MHKTAAQDTRGRYQYDTNWASMRENLCSGLVNNKGVDQPAPPRSLISAFVFRSLESFISKLPTSEILIF